MADTWVTNLVLVVNQKQDLGIVLVDEREQEGLEDGPRKSRWADVTLPPEDGVKYMESG